MNNKDLRKYDLILLAGGNGDAVAMRELATIDFATAMEVWEYRLTKDINSFGEADVFAGLNEVSEAKLRQMLLANPALQRLIYGQSVASCTGGNLDFLAGLVVANKVDEAEEILKMVKNNPTGDFTDRMQAVVDRVFALSSGKSGTKRASLNHKQNILLFEFVSKMKSGPVKNLLTQRLKEL